MRKYCYKRSDGRWQYKRQQSGMLYYAIASTYRELLEKIPNIKPKPVKNIKHKTKATNQNTFIQYYQFYIDNYIKNKKIGIETKKDWQRQLTNDITPAFKYVRLQDMTTEKVQNFIDGITYERKQETLYQRITKVLKKAYATGKIKTEITLGVEKPLRENVKERTPLTLHQQIQFLKKIKKSNLYAFYMFSIIIGSRREETLRFNLATDINEKKLEIHIHGTKTENADRYVKTTKEFIDFLKENMKSNTFRVHRSTVTHKIGEIFTELNIDNCLHGLRHTCSANLHFLGASDKYRQMQLGHASIVTTNDIYTNIRENIPQCYLRLVYGRLYPQF